MLRAQTHQTQLDLKKTVTFVEKYCYINVLIS